MYYYWYFFVQITNTIFSHGGNPIKVSHETDIDVATAIIGSGPAFILKLCQAMDAEASLQNVPSHLYRNVLSQ